MWREVEAPHTFTAQRKRACVNEETSTRRQSRTSSAWQGLAGYFKWQQREDKLEALQTATVYAELIQNGDPECETVIAALEQGWSHSIGRD